MNQATLMVIKNECEKIENGTGHGKVTITIVNGAIHLIEPTPKIMIRCEKDTLDILSKK